jgi:hypothetical protein
MKPLSLTALAIGIFLTAMAHAANATVVRSFNAATCTVVSGTPNYSNIGQIANLSTSTPLKLWCPIISDPTVGLPSVLTSAFVFVDAYNNGCTGGVPNLSATVTSVPKNGSIGTTAFFSSPGSCVGAVYDLGGTPPTMSAGDYAFITVTLGPAVSGSFSTFFGYSLTNQ